MCVMAYLASSVNVAVRDGSDLSIELVEPNRDAVRQWFSFPEVRYIGAHTGCSCGFPSVVAEQPLSWYDGLFDGNDERARDLASVRELFGLIDELLAQTSTIELLAVWAGDEFEPPDGVVRMRRRELEPEKFFFTQHFLYRIEP
jgi:hypothetical protein